jgi:hypothetical protein
MTKVQFKLDIPELEEGEGPATEKQLAYIEHLLRECHASDLPEKTMNDLGKWQASSIIDQLQDLRDDIDEIVEGTEDVEAALTQRALNGDYGERNGPDRSVLPKVSGVISKAVKMLAYILIAALLLVIYVIMTSR